MLEVKRRKFDEDRYVKYKKKVVEIGNKFLIALARLKKNVPIFRGADIVNNLDKYSDVREMVIELRRMDFSLLGCGRLLIMYYFRDDTELKIRDRLLGYLKKTLLRKFNILNCIIRGNEIPWVFEDFVIYPDEELVNSSSPTVDRRLPTVDNMILINVKRRFKELDTYGGILDIFRNHYRRNRGNTEKKISKMFSTKDLQKIITHFDKTKKIPRIKTRRVDVLYSMLVDEPDSIQKRKIESENLENPEFYVVRVKGVDLPQEIVLCILEYLPKNKKLLDGVGSVNSTLYILCLMAFKRVVISHWNVIKIPLLVLKSVRTMVVLPSRLRKDDFSYIHRKTLGVEKIVLHKRTSLGYEHHFFDTLNQKRKGCRELTVYNLAGNKIKRKYFPNLYKSTISNYHQYVNLCRKDTLKLFRKRIKKFVCKEKSNQLPVLLNESRSIEKVTMRISNICQFSVTNVDVRKSMKVLRSIKKLRSLRLFSVFGDSLDRKYLNDVGFSGTLSYFDVCPELMPGLTETLPSMTDLLQFINQICAKRKKLTEIGIVLELFGDIYVFPRNFVITRPIDFNMCTKYLTNLIRKLKERANSQILRIELKIKIRMVSSTDDFSRCEAMRSITKSAFVGHKFKLQEKNRFISAKCRIR